MISLCHPQASLKKFLDYVQTGAIEKIAKVLEKGLDPNYHDPDSGGEFNTDSTGFTGSDFDPQSVGLIFVFR